MPGEHITMSSKVVLLFLGTFLLVQSSFGRSLLRPSTEKVPAEASEKLLLYVLGEYSKVADAMLTNGKKLLQDVIADITTMDDKNDEITAKLQEYSQLVSEIEEQQTNDNVVKFENIELLIDLGDLLVESDITSISQPTSIDKLFDESLRKNGLSDLQNFFKAKFDEVFSNEFYETADEIINSTTTEEWQEKTEVQNWLKQFKNENDVIQKVKLFDQFLDLV